MNIDFFLNVANGDKLNSPKIGKLVLSLLGRSGALLKIFSKYKENETQITYKCYTCIQQDSRLHFKSSEIKGKVGNFLNFPATRLRI